MRPEKMEDEENIGAGILFDSVRRGKLRTIRYILEAVDWKLVNTRDANGRTPLITCCFIKEELTRGQAFVMLLSNGADCNATDEEGRDVLSYACEEKCNDLVTILVRYNINPEIEDNKGNTPLIYCALVGNDVALELLVRHFCRLGLHVDHANKDGFTALLVAAKMGHIHCAEILVLQGKASLLHRDRVQGFSAADWFETEGLSFKDILKSACRVVKRQRFRRMLSVVQNSNQVHPVLDTKPTYAQPRRTSDLLNRRESIITHSNMRRENDDMETNLAALRALSVKDLQPRRRGYRSLSICVPTLDNIRPKPGKLSQRQFSLQSDSGIEEWAREQVQLAELKRVSSKDKLSPSKKAVDEVSECETLMSATEIQSLSATSMEKLEQEIAELF